MAAFRFSLSLHSPFLFCKYCECVNMRYTRGRVAKPLTSCLRPGAATDGPLPCPVFAPPQRPPCPRH